jgi:hypothetical protein
MGKRRTAEQITRLLREADRELAKGLTALRPYSRPTRTSRGPQRAENRHTAADLPRHLVPGRSRPVVRP